MPLFFILHLISATLLRLYFATACPLKAVTLTLHLLRVTHKKLNHQSSFLLGFGSK